MGLRTGGDGFWTVVASIPVRSSWRVCGCMHRPRTLHPPRDDVSRLPSVTPTLEKPKGHIDGRESMPPAPEGVALVGMTRRLDGPRTGVARDEKTHNCVTQPIRGLSVMEHSVVTGPMFLHDVRGFNDAFWEGGAFETKPRQGCPGEPTVESQRTSVTVASSTRGFGVVEALVASPEEGPLSSTLSFSSPNEDPACQLVPDISEIAAQRGRCVSR